MSRLKYARRVFVKHQGEHLFPFFKGGACNYQGLESEYHKTTTSTRS